jgi:hypothetical protein
MTTLLLYGLNLLLDRNLNTRPAVEKLLSKTIHYVRNENDICIKRENTLELQVTRDKLKIKIDEKRNQLEAIKKKKQELLKIVERKREMMCPKGDPMVELQNSNFNVIQNISKMEEKLNKIKKEKLLVLKQLMNISKPLISLDFKFQYLGRFNILLVSEFFEQSPEVGPAILGEVVLLLSLITKYLEIPDLPYPITFIGSFSVIFNPLTKKQTTLNRDQCHDIEEFRLSLKNLNYNILHVSHCSGIDVSKQLLFEQDSKLGSKFLISNLDYFFQEIIKILEKKIGKENTCPHYRLLSNQTDSNSHSILLPLLPSRLPPRVPDSNKNSISSITTTNLTSNSNSSTTLTSNSNSPTNLTSNSNSSTTLTSNSNSSTTTTTTTSTITSLSTSTKSTTTSTRKFPTLNNSSKSILNNDITSIQPRKNNTFPPNNSNNNSINKPARKNNTTGEFEGFILIDELKDDDNKPQEKKSLLNNSNRK